MKNALHRERCWLVQAGVFKDKIGEITGIYAIVNLKYMGATEFERGALPESTQRMLTNIEFYDVFTFPQYENAQGEPLMVYAPRMFIEHISGIVDDLAAGKNYYLKEGCTLHNYLKGVKASNYDDFWWDIRNDFYIFFGEQKRDLVLAAQNAMRKRSIGEVEVGDWDKLSQYYILCNPDLNDEAIAFLKPKKVRLIRRLIKTLNYKIGQDTNNQS